MFSLNNLEVDKLYLIGIHPDGCVCTCVYLSRYTHMHIYIPLYIYICVCNVRKHIVHPYGHV